MWRGNCIGIVWLHMRCRFAVEDVWSAELRKALAMEKPKPTSASGKGKVGRPTTKPMPPRIDAPVKDVARAVLKTKPPKKK